MYALQSFSVARYRYKISRKKVYRAIKFFEVVVINTFFLFSPSV